MNCALQRGCIVNTGLRRSGPGRGGRKRKKSPQWPNRGQEHETVLVAFCLGAFLSECSGEEQSEGCPPHPHRTCQPGLLFQKVIGIGDRTCGAFP